LQSIARLFGIVVVFKRIPAQSDHGMEGSKTDFEYLDRVSNLIAEFTGEVPGNIFEVGANFAQDAAYLARKWHLTPDNVVVFESHPEISGKVRNHYDFQVVPKAVAIVNSVMEFNAVKLGSTLNTGISSLLQHSVNDQTENEIVEVEVIRLDSFAEINGWKRIDFLKIDVEGMTFEVLEGLGDFLENVRYIQIETELIPVWKGQRTQQQVYQLLEENRFQLIEHLTQMDGVQADSLWIRQDLVIHKIYDLTKKQWVIKT